MIQIDAQSNIANHTLCNILAIQRFDVKIRGPARSRTLGPDTISIIRGAIDLRMTSIWLEGHNAATQVLVKVHLARRNHVAGYHGAVVAHSPVRVRAHVDVDGALHVEAGEHGAHFHDAVVVRRPHSAQPRRVVAVQIEVWVVYVFAEGGE